MNRFKTLDIQQARVHILATEKFKTTTCVAFIQQELTKENVTKTALLPPVLQRGTISYPETILLKRKLDALYGASLFGDVMKRGDSHILHFGMELANEKYLKKEEDLLRTSLHLLHEVLFSPAIEGNGFKKSFVGSEKKNLKQKIESLADDKIRYASQRMIEVMCDNESYSLYQHGRIKDISSINEENLYAYYKEVIGSCPIDLYCIGNFDISEVEKIVRELFSSVPSLSQKRKKISPKSRVHSKSDVKVVVDELDVKQGKLNMGSRTNIYLGDKDYPALLLYNGILGGFPHSKLFMNVREKESLAYYASSKLESLKGLLMIQSGIEIHNYKKAVEIIKEQLELLRKGQITDSELNQTKAMIKNQLMEQQDRSIDMILFHYQAILGDVVDWSVDRVISLLNEIDKRDIQKVAEKVDLDTIYFLRDKEANNANK